MSLKKTEVLFCTDGISHAVGGMQRHSRLLIEQLASMGNMDLTVIHPHEGVNVFNNPAIKEIVLIPETSSGRNTLLIVTDIQSRFIKLRFWGVIYSQGLSVWYHIRKLKNRVIVNPHGLEPYQTLSTRDYLTGAPFRLIFNSLFKNAGKVVSLGGRLTGILQKHTPKGNIEVLPNAVNVPEITPRNFETNSSPSVLFLFVGRFALNKGINILAEAVKQLNEEGYSEKLSLTW